MATTRVSDGLSKRDFPEGFIFGASSASYQYEGGYNEDGKGPSIWDTYTHKFPEKILDRSNGDVAVNSYHLYKEDVKMLTNMGMNGYRFSISWPRILPNGKLSGGVNEKGVAYYNNLINHLLENGITPFVTLFHWDLPQALEDEYEGFLSPNIVNDFKDYAEVCFKAFGDRVKHWTTLNEPRTFAVGGYVTGHLAPSKTTNSGIDPYLVTHYQLLAHAAAVKLYRDKYQQGQEGKIGIALNTFWMAPTNKHKDKEAAQRALDFMYGWYMDPLVHGDYPKCMRELVKDRLPKFKEDEVMLLKGSYDFIGLNYYTSDFVEDCSPPPDAKPCYSTDSHTTLEGKRNGIPIGRPTASGWLYVYPLGFYDLLRYTKHHYNNPVIYITENGMSRPNDPKLPLEEALNDEYRIAYYDHHLFYLHKAMKEGANVKGYLPWSLLDNFEWSSGFTVRFGLNYVDYNDGFKRYPKKSAEWFKNLLNK